jgi:hypothetical protein
MIVFARHLMLCVLFIGTVSSPDYVASNGRMKTNNALEGTCTEAVGVYFNV